MTIVLLTLAVACAAFCVWLTVRIVNRREKPGKAFWITVAIVGVLAAYPLSFWPAVHLYARGVIPEQSMIVVYRPIRGLLHAVVRHNDRSKYVAFGSERVQMVMQQLVACLYGPAAPRRTASRLNVQPRD